MQGDPAELVARANAILFGRSASPNEILRLVKPLHEKRYFGLARKLLDRLSTDPAVTADGDLRLRVAHKRALATYKDPDLSTEAKLEQALAILQEADDLETTANQETLGLAGAIHKRMWENTGRERLLETALAFYLRGFEQGVENDYGYTATNAAFILDVLADLESVDEQSKLTGQQTADARREQARAVRRAIAATLPGLATPELENQWWFLVTLGEAYFCLEQYEEAERWLVRAAELPHVPDWERESSSRQLAELFRVEQRHRRRMGKSLDERAERALEKFFGDAGPALASALRGKVGLALSGGGFRASLYHIGVLARLAELDLLRHVEYLSCVSGGAILGAHYYLEVRKLLREKADAEITRDDYIAIVERLSRDFLLGVQRNVRTRIAAEWLTNLKMVFLPDYSRTLRAGELYESEIYSLVKDGEGGKPRWLHELLIHPPDEPPDFRPKDHNWRRANKIPILVLNATTLNTGHNWQFTASWMGEPPAGIDAKIDSNSRLRRMYYEDAPPPHDRMRLGYAVAASACVPGLFEPLSLGNLYPGHVVRLVDGGVHDNQGTAALLEQGCSVLLVSDASGQMDDESAPSKGLLGVPLRSNSVLQARIRVSQYEDLENRLRAGTLKGLMFVHLKHDLGNDVVDWIDCQDPSRQPDARPLTSYGVQREVQRRLAGVRTDLDSFSEVEAYALMTSGYVMTEAALSKPVLGFEVEPAPRTAFSTRAGEKASAWPFLGIEPFMWQAGKDSPLLRQLGAAKRLAFKVWVLVRPLQLAAGLLALVVLFWLGFSIRLSWGEPLFTIAPTLGDLSLSVGSAIMSLLGFGLISRLVQYRKTVQDILIGVGMSTVGFLFARLHLHVFDRLFLWQGGFERVAASSARRSRGNRIQIRRLASETGGSEAAHAEATGVEKGRRETGSTGGK